MILLDEPFTGIDVKTEDARLSGCCGTCATSGTGLMLVSTHNLGSGPRFLRPHRGVDQPARCWRPGRPVGGLHPRMNLERAFGGALRHFVSSAARGLHDDDDRASASRC
jgi:manganese/iron transport system ATP-binding protein